MSQKDVFELLKELGRTAPSKEITKLAKQKYPKRTLHLYVGNRLRKLQKRGYVELISEDDKIWRIKRDNFP